MMKLALLATATLSAAALTVPAAAATFDAFASFDGTQGAGNFFYGEANAATPNMSGSFFTANTNCFIAGSTCLQLLPDRDVPGFTKSTTPSFQYNSVNVPTDRLLAHPDDDTDATFVAFVAPKLSRYRLDATFNVQDVNPSGVGISLITTTNGALPLIFTPIGSISGGNPTLTYSIELLLDQSFAAGFGLDNAGFVGNDSTGVQFAVTAVPEPASWAMMLAGFGLAGAVIRRRASATRSVLA